MGLSVAAERARESETNRQVQEATSELQQQVLTRSHCALSLPIGRCQLESERTTVEAMRHMWREERERRLADNTM